ncbi:MAG: DnaB-like helicase N-terminal domain-containing protein [Alphaproteobacteria bacterium]
MNDSLFEMLATLPMVSKLLRHHTNPDVEQALLGVLLTSQGAFARTVGRVTADDFADPVHAVIFDAIAERVGKGRRVDHLLLADVAKDCDEALRDVGGGQAYLAQLAATPMLPTAIPDYSDTLRGLAQRRRLIEAGLRAIVGAHEARRPDEAVAAAIGEAEALVDDGGAKTRAQVLAEMVEGMQRPAKIYSTGYPCLDKAMGGGLHAGRVYCFGGLGKSGKSMLAGGISRNLNAYRTRHGYLALEMGALEIEQRQVAREIGTHSMALLGNVHATILGRVGQVAARAAEGDWNDVLYVDMPGGTFDRLRTEVLSLRYRHRCVGAIVDYWQLVSGRPNGMSEEEHLRRVAEWLASAAKRLGMWFVVLAQLTDDGEATAISRTGMLRNADQVYFIRFGDLDKSRWLECKASRYTPPKDIGEKDDPSLLLEYPGPHFRDWTDRGTDPAAVQAQHELAEG